MAKILILFYQPNVSEENSNAVLAFYESIISELCNQSNDVCYINLALLKDYWSSDFDRLKKKETEEIVFKIKQFNPDVIFTFNNQITKEIIQNTSCPVCVMDADNTILFPNKELISENQERYYLFSYYKDWESDKYETIGIKKENIGFLHLATSVKNENLEKTANISFIGSNFGLIHPALAEKLENTGLNEDLQKYYKDQYENAQNFFDKYTKLLDVRECDLYGLIDVRLKVLQSVSDLGLKIYGVGWDKLPDEMLNLKLCYDKTPKYTLKHNSDVYNSSKINISISHPQCKGYAYPWRVCDIMASGGLLVSSYSKLLEEQTKNIVKIPMFKSPYEARDLCKYALDNPDYCKDIIAASNEYIEKCGRWSDNFEKIGELVKVSVINSENKRTQPINFAENITVKKQKPPKKRIKQIINGGLLMLSNIPVLELIFSEKMQKKLYSSINKHNNF